MKKVDVRITNYDPQSLSVQYDEVDKLTEQEPNKSTIQRYIRKQRVSSALGTTFSVLCVADILIALVFEFAKSIRSTDRTGILILWALVPFSILSLFFLFDSVYYSEKTIAYLNNLFSPALRFYEIVQEYKQISCSGKILDRDNAVVTVKVLDPGTKKLIYSDEIEFSFFGPTDRPSENSILTLDVGREVVYWS